MEFQGKLPYNSETCIDFKSRAVTFSYPCTDETKTQLCYFCSVFTNILSHIFEIIVYVYLLVHIKSFTSLIISLVKYYQVEIISLRDSGFPIFNTISICVMIILFICWFLFRLSMIYLAGTISRIIFSNSKYMKDRFPIINSWLKWNKKKYIIDLSKERYDKLFFYDGTKLYFMKYCIIKTEYEIEGHAKDVISKIYTKMLGNEKQKKNPCWTNFVLVAEFNQPFPEGKMMFRC